MGRIIKTIIDIVFTILAGIAIIFIMSLYIYMSAEDKTAELICNNCGGDLKYEQTISHLFSTSAIYKCEKCGKVYEIKL